MFTMIAVIKKDSTIVGYRLIDEDNKIYNVSASGVKNDATNNPDNFTNIKVIDGEILGSNGVIDRYTDIDMMSEQPIDKVTSVILKRVADEDDNTLGYIISDYKGEVRKFRTEDVIKVCSGNGIANGRIIVKDNVEYVSAIKGEYNTHVLQRMSEKENKKDNNQLAVKHVYNETVSKGNRTDGLVKIARNTAEDASSEIEFKDNFNNLSAAQRSIIKEFYIWYTVELFESLTHGKNRLKMSAKKADKIARIRSMSENWKFAGVVDTALTGEDAHCEFGHKIRYKYYAVPDDDSNDTRINHKKIVYTSAKERIMAGEEALKDRGAIAFGEGCASDFFDVDVEDMKKLIKVRNKMSEEIENICKTIEDGPEAVKKNWDGLDFLCKCIDKMYSGANGNANAVELFGENMANSERQFRKNNIPYTMSMVLYMTDKINKNKEKFYDCCWSAKSDIYLKNRPHLVRFIEEELIDGMYMYDPRSVDKIRKDKGGYNDKTRRLFEDAMRSAIGECGYYSSYYRIKPIEVKYDIIDDCANFYYFAGLVGDEISNIVDNKLSEYKGLSLVMTNINYGYEPREKRKFFEGLTALCSKLKYDFLNDNEKDEDKFILRILGIAASLNETLTSDGRSSSVYGKTMLSYNDRYTYNGAERVPYRSWSFYTYSNRVYGIKDDVEIVKSLGLKPAEFVEKANEVIEKLFSEQLSAAEKAREEQEAKKEQESEVSDTTNETVNSSEDNTEDKEDIFSMTINNAGDYDKKLEYIAKVVDNHGELMANRRVLIAMDIKSRNITVNRLSDKQKWTIDQAFEECKNQHALDVGNKIESTDDTTDNTDNTDDSLTENQGKSNIELMVETQAMVEDNNDFLSAFKGIAKQVVEKDELKKNEERFKELSKKMSEQDISNDELNELKDIVKKLYDSKDRIDSNIVEFVEKLYEFVK